MEKAAIRHRCSAIGLSCLMLFFCSVPPALAQLDLTAHPPVAPRIPHVTDIHGDHRVDNYFWLREKSNPEVRHYLEAENAYTAAVMKPTEPFQSRLYQEMLGRIKETDLDVPHRNGDWWYYQRTEKGKQYPIQCRRKRRATGPEQVILDLNDLAKGRSFLAVGASTVSDDGNLLAYTTDITGFREYTLQVKDLRTGLALPVHIPKVQTLAWGSDNRTLLYVQEDAAKRPYRLYRHVLGTTSDQPVYEEKDELYRLTVERSRDRKFLFATSRSSTTTEVRYLPAADPSGTWQIVRPRETNHEYYVDHRGDKFYIRTDHEAPNFRLVTAPVSDPGAAHWKDLVPHRRDTYLEHVDLFARYCVLSERFAGLPTRRILDLETGAIRAIDFPEPTYSVLPDFNEVFDTTLFRFRYQSLITPESVFDYDMATGRRSLLKRTEVLGGYDPAQYTTERIFATASDGAKIPISIAFRKSVRRDGTAPLLLYGYGSYGFSVPITFQSQRLSLLDRGVIFAIAHIRGGSEMGRAWYEDGKMMHKRNTFTDFIAAADHLVARQYTAHARMAIQGGSAGGLLIGAVLNMRPDLCKAAVLMVPFVDVINTMLDASLPLTVQEYLEWGNPNVRSEYEYIKTYCPYTNLGPHAYPAMLVMTSLNDSQVMYWEPAKYVAKLRSLKTDTNPLLFRCRMAGGHGGASGRYDALHDAAFIAAFILTELGITK